MAHNTTQQPALRRGAPPNNTIMAEFIIWDKEVLAQFARDAQERMTQQDAEIEALRADLQALLTAYRALVVASQSATAPP